VQATPLVTGLFAAADRAGQRVTEFFSKLLDVAEMKKASGKAAETTS
jgi:hypothetical protein